MTSSQFTVDPTSQEGFYVIVGDTIAVYHHYSDALADIQPTLADDTDAFLAELLIHPAPSDEDVTVALEQVPWQTIIRDLATTPHASATLEDGTDQSAAHHRDTAPDHTTDTDR